MREFIQQHPQLNMTEDDIVKTTLTKAERQLKDKFDGRPGKPPSYVYRKTIIKNSFIISRGIIWIVRDLTWESAVLLCLCCLVLVHGLSYCLFRNGYSMFCAELMSGMKDVPSTERMVMCSQRWKLLKQNEKDAYQKRCEQVREQLETLIKNTKSHTCQLQYRR